jgi:hypothetical protein
MKARSQGGLRAYYRVNSFCRTYAVARGLWLGFQQYAADSDSNSNSHAVAEPRTLADSASITQPHSRGHL